MCLFFCSEGMGFPNLKVITKEGQSTMRLKSYGVIIEQKV